MKRDFAKCAHRDRWIRHPVLGDPSFDTFRHAPVPVHRSAPPFEWTVNGSLFRDPRGGALYLYAGHYPKGYALNDDAPMHATVYRSIDGGKSWDHIGKVFGEEAFSFEGDSRTSSHAPDVVAIYADGRYYLAYDWLDDKKCGAGSDSGAGLAVADSPEGPFRRLPQPIFRNSAMNGRLGKYSRLYATTVLRRKHDWLALSLVDSGKYFAWGFAAMTAPSPEGPWSAPELVLSPETDAYYPAPVEFHPAFVVRGQVRAPATSVAMNRNYQAVFGAPLEKAHDPAAWRLECDGGMWHSNPDDSEYHGIWGQTLSGFVRGGIYRVMFPSRDRDGMGVIKLAERPWSRPASDSFVFSGHGGPSITLLKHAYGVFSLDARLRRPFGTASIIWGYTGTLGPDAAKSDAVPHRDALSNHLGLRIDDRGWCVFKNEFGSETVLLSEEMPACGDWNIKISHSADCALRVEVNGRTASLFTEVIEGPIGLIAGAHSHTEVSRFAIEGEPLTARIAYSAVEGLLNAGQDSGAWTINGSSVSGGGDVRLKWNFYGTGFELRAARGPGLGRARIIVDGSVSGSVDLNADEPAQAASVVFAIRDLKAGRHAAVLEPEEGAVSAESLISYNFRIPV